MIEPIFERSFIHDSYANRKGKGTHRAIDRAQYFSRRYPYVLSVDVRQFFPSIDHEVLRSILAKKIADSDVMALQEQSRQLEQQCRVSFGSVFHIFSSLPVMLVVVIE